MTEKENVFGDILIDPSLIVARHTYLFSVSSIAFAFSIFISYR